MRTAPVALWLVVLVAGLHPAIASAADGGGEIKLVAPLQASNGLSARLDADQDGIQLTIRKQNQYALYLAQGEVRPDGVTVKFGRFGEFIADYEPTRTLTSREPGRHCEGEPQTFTEGFLRGTLRFRGERGYVRIEAAQAKATMELRPEWTCDYARPATSRPQSPRERDLDQATLTARSSGKPSIRFTAYSRLEAGKKPAAGFAASRIERLDGVDIVRLTTAETRSAGGFSFDHRAGTARVDPPAPFSGSAQFLRRPGAPDLWAGDLSAHFLGLGRVRFAGRGFRAGLAPELPNFERAG
ncbi:MAG TPA: hypothetical protein VIT85_04930 [Solirubrobacterales bacterium]